MSIPIECTNLYPYVKQYLKYLLCCHLYYTHIQAIWRIPGGQKLQSGNQVAVNADFNYFRTLDQSYL